MNQMRRKYQAPLQRISEVSSPGVRSSQTIEDQKMDPLSMGESYTSFLRIKQEKEQQNRKHHREELKQREEQIDRLKEEVIEIKVEIGALENKLEQYKYPSTCDCSIFQRLMDICRRWLRHPSLKLSRQFLCAALLHYYSQRNKKKFVYGRLLYWMLGIFEIISQNTVKGAAS